MDRQLSSVTKAEEPVEQKASEATQKSQQQTPKTISATDRAGAKEKLDQGGETAASRERKQNEQDREGASAEQPAGKDVA